MLKPFAIDSTVQPQRPGWDDRLGFEYRELDAMWLARWTAGAATVLAPLTTINCGGVDHKIGDGKPGPGGKQFPEVLLEIQRKERPDLWGWLMELPA